MKALAKNLNCPAKIPPDLFSRVNSGQMCLLNCFKINCQSYTEDEKLNLVTYKEQCHGGYYDENFWNCSVNTDIFGHFESELYFKNIKDEIKKEYELKDDIANYTNNYLNQIKEKYAGYEIIALHFRLGDYNEVFPEYCTEKYNNEFLDKAFKFFEHIDKKIFLVFTGGATDNNNTEDIKLCKYFLRNRKDIFLYSENNSTIIDFGLILICDHLITNSMSSLSWWSGFLNKNPDKIIVAPNLPYKSKDYWFKSVKIISK
jgi:hypothetical protein